MALRTDTQPVAAAAAVVPEARVYRTGADKIPTEGAGTAKTLQASTMHNRRRKAIGMAEVGRNSGVGADAEAASKTAAEPARTAVVMAAFGRTAVAAAVSKMPDTEPVGEVEGIAGRVEGGAVEGVGW